MNRVCLVNGLSLLGLAAAPRTAPAQPWVVFEDAASGSACGIVNTASEELVVLEATGELMLISGEDVVLADTFVDEANTVFFQGEEAGFIDFFEDGENLATLWWVIDESGEVVELDESFVPIPSGTFPEDYIDVPCDACEFWDDPADCEGPVFDEDLDEVPDEFDLCPGTPGGEPVDADGCSCLDFDTDGDGIDDCADQCEDTPEDELADDDGCSCSVFDSDADGVDDCDDRCAGTPATVDVDNDGCTIRPGPPPGQGGGGGGGGGGCGAFTAPALALTLTGFAGVGLLRRRN